jgi:hypothetical protein
MSPLSRDTEALSEYLLGRFSSSPQPLPNRICHTALDLHESIMLAFQGRRTLTWLYHADEQLCVLRALLRLAHSQHMLDDTQLLHGSRMTESIGRQLGGWLKRLETIEQA